MQLLLDHEKTLGIVSYRDKQATKKSSEEAASKVGESTTEFNLKGSTGRSPKLTFNASEIKRSSSPSQSI